MLEWLLTHSPLLYFTQSLWRDEAFSILASQKPLAWIVSNLSFEPPVYYTMLHFWIKLFGQSEIAARSLSLLGFSLATIVVIRWAEKLFPKHWLRWFLPLFFFLNPMLLYYAFEVRTYGWYTFFAVLSFFAYSQKRWRLLIAANVLGFYTHTYMLIVPFAQLLHWLLVHRSKLRIKSIIQDPTIRSFTVTGLLIAPWIVKVAMDLSQLKQSWYFPVNIHLVESVLGNMFLGYEGTPWYFWTYTKWLSVILLFFFVIALRDKRNRERNSFFVIAAIAPLVLVVGVSFLKPLFVNRYLIAVTVAEVFLLCFAISAIKNSFVQKLTAFGFLLFVIIFNLWYPKEHPKLDIRKTINEVTMLKDKQDLILVDNPLAFFETIYYAKDQAQVFLYNPNNSPFPWYVGGSIVSSSQMTNTFPEYPVRAFLVHADGTYTLVYQTPLANHNGIKQIKTLP